MFSLAFLKSRAFIVLICFVVFIGFTYKVYDVGYDTAVGKLSAKAVEAQYKHDTAVAKIEADFAKMEREFLKEEAIDRARFERDYKGTLGDITDYVEANNYTDCSIGTVGVQRVNDLLKGGTTDNK